MASLRKWFPFRFKREAAAAPISTTATSPLPRLFEQMMNIWGDNEGFFGNFAPARFKPGLDLVDDDKHLKISAELPGLDAADIKLEVHEGMLTIQGEKKMEQSSDEEGCYRTERYFGSFQRTVPLPVDVDTNAAEAVYDKGVLTIRLPKLPEKAPSRTISVSASH